jgi:hypothetical protein
MNKNRGSGKEMQDAGIELLPINLLWHCSSVLSGWSITVIAAHLDYVQALVVYQLIS